MVGKFTISSIPLFFVFRFFLATTSYSTGASGGIFSPLLSLGALLGFAVGYASQYVAPSVVTEPAVFAVVGMARITSYNVCYTKLLRAAAFLG